MKAARNDKVTKELNTKQKNRNKNIRLILVSAIIALLAFVAITILQSNILDMEESIRVYVVKTNIDEGTKITQSNLSNYFKVEERVINTLPKNHVKEGEADKLVYKYAGKAYVSEEIVTTEFIEDRASIKSDLKNPVEISFSSAAVNAVGGILREGDIVNIYYQQEETKGTSTQLLLGQGYIEKAFEGTTLVANDNKEAVTTMFNIVVEEEIATYFFDKTKGVINLTKVLYDVE